MNDSECGKPLALRLGEVLDGEHADDIIAALGYICGAALAPLSGKQFEQWVENVRTLNRRSPSRCQWEARQ
jgi:hypothetical protein